MEYIKIKGRKGKEIMKKTRRWTTLAIMIAVLVLGIHGTSMTAFAAFNVSGTEPVKKGGDGYEAWHETHHGWHSTWKNPGSGFIVPASYTNIIRSTGDTTYSTFGKSCKVSEALKAYDKDHPDAERASPAEDRYYAFDIKENSKGGFGMWARSLKIYDNEKKDYVKVDCKVTVVDWEDETDKTPNARHLTIQKSARPNIDLSGLEEATLKWDYFLAGTNTRYQVKSNVTFDDIDAQQYVAFKADQVLFQFVAENTRLSYKVSNGFNGYYNPDKENYKAGDPRNAFGSVYQTNTLQFTYGTKNQGTWSHFGYLAYAMFEPTPNDPTKTVSDSDEKGAGEIMLSGANETFTYEVEQVVASGYASETYFKNFTLEDTLEDCLQVESAKVKCGSADSDRFDVSVNGTTVKAQAKASALQSDDFYDKTYTLVIKAKLKPGITAEDLGPYLDGEIAEIPNKATVTINDKPRSTSQVMVRVWEPKPTKRVSDQDETKVLSNTIPSRLEAFTYDVEQSVPAQVKGLTKFGFTDQVETCLEVKGVKILEGGTDVTSSWNVTTEGNHVQAFAKNTGAALAGKSYSMRITAQVKNVSDTQLESHGHYNAAQTSLNFKNKARLIYRIGNAGSDSGADTNQVDTTVRLPVDIKITKDVDRYEHQVGNPIHYTVKVRHDTAGCDATDIVVQDTDLEHFDLDLTKAKVSGVTDYKLEPVSGGWKFITGKLAQGQEVVIQFEAKAKKVLNGSIAINTARVKCFGVPEKSDKEEVYINSPKMDIKKTSDRKQYKVGDTIDYELEVTQINKGCFMRDVIFTDTIQVEGVKLMPGTIIVLDKKGKILTNSMDITVKDDAFTLETGRNFSDSTESVPPKEQGKEPYKDLDLTGYMKICYSAKIASSDLAGSVVANKAETPARPDTNGDPVKEDPDIPSGGSEIEHMVPVVGAELRVTKTSDKQTYKVGETGHYTVKVEQIREDYKAENVTIQDKFQMEGMKIKKDSLRIKHERTDITDSCKIEVTDNSYTIETNRDLPYNESMTVTYDVEFTSQTLQDKEILNTAAADADNAEKKETDHVVEIGQAPVSLEIVKSSDKKEYEPGEPIQYQLDVSSTGIKKAEKVVIKDKILTLGVTLRADSIRVFNDAKEDITSKCEIQVEGNAFTIQTGQDLEPKKHISVTYEAAADKSLAGKKVDNAAVADADNAVEKNTEHTVLIIDTAASLQVEKRTDKELYSIGEPIQYTLIITSKGPYKAKNVVIQDTIKTKGMTIDADSIQIKDSDGRDITKSCKMESNALGFTIYTERELEVGKQLMVTYKAHGDESIIGKKIENIATATSDNGPPAETEHTVSIKPGAQLEIKKTSTKKEYRIYEPIAYKLQVRTISKITAENVVIQDQIETKGMEILPGTLRIASEQGDITKECEIKEVQTSFEIQTGKDLSYGKILTVTYSAKITDAEMMGKQIKNIAIAKGSNAPPVKDELFSNIQEEDEGMVIAMSKDKDGDHGGGMIVQTGDEFKLMLYVLALGAAALVMLGLLVRRKKTKK